MSRIVAGTAGGRRLETPEGQATRPTSDRVREAFFSVLASWNGTGDAAADRQLADLAFLDLFAGSGAMGLEAASRGAGPVLLVESDARAAQVIGRNIEATGLDADLRVCRAEALLATRGPDEPFDVVWLDPPYALEVAPLEDLLRRVLDQGWVRADGVIVVERGGRGPAPQLPGTDAWERRYGDTVLYWFAPQEAGDR